VVHVSGLTGQGVQALWEVLHKYAAEIDVPATLAAFSERQVSRIADGLQHLQAAAGAAEAGMPLDAVAVDLYAAREALHGVYEHADRSAVIKQVFASFCVGK
jgi:tRNA U34 5-carboxymethylaminomethyl modifying GTPase MnmE/TrmE